MGASLKSQGYAGYEAVVGSIHSGDASTPASTSGVFMWSGSKQLYGNINDPSQSKTNYFGVGLELVANSESYFRFRSKTGSAAGAGSELDVRTDTFFLGSSDTFISGSGDGTIAITSSNFHLEVGGDITMAGTITAEAGGTIGGWSLTTSDIYSLDSGTPGSSPNDGMVISTASGSDDKAVIKVYDGTDVNAALGNYASGKFGILASEGNIGGWEINADYLEGENIIMSATGSLQTKDFQDGITTAVSKGWKISEDGTANFASARIRGTLSTAVFEKETISAVGGAAIIANATTIASGSDYSSDGLTAGSSTQAIEVDNAGGFAADEWIICKSTSSTGFVEEWMQVTATDITSSPHTITVKRGMTGAASMAPTLTPGQVLVSQGKAGLAGGTGYILLNATSGSTTPYIDIVERTGNTNFDDIDIKVRLGDLSGINDSTVGLSNTDTFGLYTDNVYLKGTISSSAGRIGGWNLAHNLLSGGSGGSYIGLIPGTGIQMGNETFGNAPFSVTNAGVLKATSGTIGGWTLGATTLSATNIILDPSGPNIQLAGKTTFADNNVDGVYIGTEGIAIGDDNEFTVTNAGVLTATSANITGTITATDSTFTGTITAAAGAIGGWTIADGSITAVESADSSGISLISGDTPAIIIHGDGVGKDNFGPGNVADNVKIGIGEVSPDKFGLKAFNDDGDRIFEISEVRHEIAGWAINETSLSKTGLVLSAGASPYIQVGTPGTEASPNTNIKMSGGTNGKFELKSFTNPRVTIDDNFITGGESPAGIDWGGILIDDGLLMIDNAGGNLGATKAGVNLSMRNLEYGGAGAIKSGMYVGLSEDAGSTISNANSIFDIDPQIGSTIGLGVHVKTTGNCVGMISKVDEQSGFVLAASITFLGVGGQLLNEGNISSQAEVVAYSSDKRLKENISPIENPLEKIKKLRGVYFDWKDNLKETVGFEPCKDWAKNEIGMIAQELEEVIPQAVCRAPFDISVGNKVLYKNGERTDGETEPYKTIKMEKIVPLLIESIKEQQKQIELLTKKIEALESK